MRFISTRGGAADIGFRQAVLSGLAPDGGLYMPDAWPVVPTGAQQGAFSEVAGRVLKAFAGDDLSEAVLRDMAARAYGLFDAPDVAPLRHLGGDDYLLELFHGPTLAFKDVAMRMLAELYGWAIQDAARGKTIIGATSGDTGGAAVSAFAGSPKVEVFMLHPKGRISAVQRRMMTTTGADNIANIAVEGSFDDCQRIVKSLFADAGFSAGLDLGGVNSINFVRLAVQTIYYFTAATALGRTASFIVPTGNFGDAFAGYAAKRMGLSAGRLCVAVNSNDIMRRVLTTGVYAPRGAMPTSSPSMDIEVASNFERLIFEASGRDPVALASLMSRFEREGRMVLPEGMREAVGADFAAERATEEETAEMIDALWKTRKILVDPHTAVGLVALQKLRRAGLADGPAICLATAHPAKFPDAVEAASGVRPALPPRYADLMTREEALLVAPADAGVIGRMIRQRSRFSAKDR